MVALIGAMCFLQSPRHLIFLKKISILYISNLNNDYDII